MLRVVWLSAEKDRKGNVIAKETFGTLHLSDRFEDGKARMILRDIKGQESVLSAMVTKGENDETSIQIVFEPIN